MPDSPLQQALNAKGLETIFGKEYGAINMGKAWAVSTHDRNTRRKDECGVGLGRRHHAGRDSGFGREFKHISRGARDDLSGPRALHWRNNVHTGVGGPRCTRTHKVCTT